MRPPAQGQRRKRVNRRHKKLGVAAEESVRGAQRGLLVLLGSLLVWVVVIWAGYHYLS
jgi:hypothetical protein